MLPQLSRAVKLYLQRMVIDSVRYSVLRVTAILRPLTQEKLRVTVVLQALKQTWLQRCASDPEALQSSVLVSASQVHAPELLSAFVLGSYLPVYT